MGFTKATCSCVPIIRPSTLQQAPGSLWQVWGLCLWLEGYLCWITMVWKRNLGIRLEGRVTHSWNPVPYFPQSLVDCWSRGFESSVWFCIILWTPIVCTFWMDELLGFLSSTTSPFTLCTVDLFWHMALYSDLKCWHWPPVQTSNPAFIYLPLSISLCRLMFVFLVWHKRSDSRGNQAGGIRVTWGLISVEGTSLCYSITGVVAACRGVL